MRLSVAWELEFILESLGDFLVSAVSLTIDLLPEKGSFACATHLSWGDRLPEFIAAQSFALFWRFFTRRQA